MKLLSEKEGLRRLDKLKARFREKITRGYEFRAKSCAACPVKGNCCTDAHFVNVRISRLEAAAIKRLLDSGSESNAVRLWTRIDESIRNYDLGRGENPTEQKFACPLFEKGVGCLIHTIKPIPCIAHACYENPQHLPPDSLAEETELAVDRLTAQTYGRPQQWLPLPLALRSIAPPI